MSHTARTSSRSIARAALAVAAAAGLALTAACAPTGGPGSSGEPSSEPSSEPSPSTSPIDTAPPAEGEGEAVPIPDGDPRLEDAMSSQEFPLVEWTEPGETMAIFLGGSGSSNCVPAPLAATVASTTEIEMAFAPPTGDLVCTADFRVYGWEVPISDEVDAAAPVTVTITGLGGDGEPTVVTLEP